MNWVHTEKMMGFCEHGDVLYKDREFLDQLSKYQLFEEKPVHGFNHMISAINSVCYCH